MFSIHIDDANFCDELSWNELHNLNSMSEILSISILLSFSSYSSLLKSSVKTNSNLMSSFRKKASRDSEDERSSRRTNSTMTNLTFDRKSSRRGSTGSSNRISNNNQENRKPSLLSTLKNIQQIKTFFGLNYQPVGSCLSILQDKNTVIIDLLDYSQDCIKYILKPLVNSNLNDDDVDKELTPRLTIKIINISYGRSYWIDLMFQCIEQNGYEKIMNEENIINMIFKTIYEELTVMEQMIVKYASVIGNDFTSKSLFNILPGHAHNEMRNTLDILLKKGIIFCSSYHPALVYSFENQLVRSTIYSYLSQAERAKIHLDIAVHTETYINDVRPYYYL